MSKDYDVELEKRLKDFKIEALKSLRETFSKDFLEYIFGKELVQEVIDNNYKGE